MSEDEVFNDETLMPFGAHKGVKLCNVPDHYLKWLYETYYSCKIVRGYGAKMRDYIEDNADSIGITIIKKG